MFNKFEMMSSPDYGLLTEKVLFKSAILILPLTGDGDVCYGAVKWLLVKL